MRGGGGGGGEEEEEGGGSKFCYFAMRLASLTFFVNIRRHKATCIVMHNDATCYFVQSAALSTPGLAHS
jgi:hypothetical protein